MHATPRYSYNNGNHRPQNPDQKQMAKVRGGRRISRSAARKAGGDHMQPQPPSQPQSTVPSQPQLDPPTQPQLTAPSQLAASSLGFTVDEHTQPQLQPQLTAPSQVAPNSEGFRVGEHTQPELPPQSTDLSQLAPNSRGLRVGEHTQPQLQWQLLGTCTYSDAAYFNYYGGSGSQRMINQDPVWTKAYKDAILHHQSRIQGKVVMDVGCGLGILSIFCAQAGASQVYAVDASNIAAQAKEIVKANNLDNQITVLHARVEDIDIKEKVDVIISNWMGRMLLHEGMLGSVITAKDRFLKHGGLILPSDATLYMAPITDPDRYSESIGFWRTVYGVDMSSMMQYAKQCELGAPWERAILAANVLTSPHVVMHVNCSNVRIDELKSVTTEFRLQSMVKAPMHGFAFWFAVGFSGLPTYSNNPTQSSLNMSSDHSPADDCQRIKRLKREEVNVVPILSTAPKDALTHWKQIMVYLPDGPIELDKDQLIEGSLTISQLEETPRDLSIQTRFTVHAVQEENPLDSGQ